MQYRCKECQRAYNATPERRAYNKTYDSNPERRAVRKVNNDKPERKASRQAYNVSIAGKIVRHRSEAKKRGLENTLTDAQLEVLFMGDCFYCGEPPLNGVDRVDNTLGYLLDNVVSCCAFCNVAKNKHTQKEFIAMCKRVAEKHSATS